MSGPGMSLSIRSFATPLLLALAACSDSTGVADAGTDARAGRLARDRARADAAIRAMEGSGAHESLMAAIAPYLAEGEVPDWIPFDGWAAKGSELSTYHRWNTPDPVTGIVPALDFERENHAVNVLAYYAKELASRGIELFVVLVPSRIQVYPDRIPGVAPQPESFAGVGPGYARVLRALADAGVEVIDLLPALAGARYDRSGEDDERVFLDYDHHWTPRGAEIAAKVIAARLRELRGLGSGPAREGIDFEVRRELGPWKAMQLEREDGGFVPVTEHAVAEVDQPVNVWFRRVVTPAGERVEVEDRASPILLLADSFGGYYEGADSDIKRLLYAETGAKVDKIVLLGAGGRTAWKAVARRGDDLAGKKVVIWLFTARSLANENLKTIPLFGE